MPHHLAAFFESQDGGGTEQALAALADPLSQLVTTSGDDFRPIPDLRFIAGLYAGLDHTVAPRARLISEGIRRRYGQFFVPMLNSGAEPGSPPLFNDWRATPVELDRDENLQFHTVNNPAGATDQFAVLWLSNGPVSPSHVPNGFWVRATTAASAMTVNTWNDRALTFDTALQTGQYECWGLWGKTTSGIAVRLAFPGQNEKPGVLCVDAEADVPHRAFEVPGQWGMLGRFHSTNPPTSQWLVDAADNEAQELRMYVRKVG